MRKTMLTTLAIATIAISTGGALADEKPASLTPPEQAEARLVLQTARNLISYGEARHDALALVTAAKMMSGVSGRVLADGESGGNGATFDVEAVLKQAEQAAKGDETILKLAGQVRLSATANTKAICYWEYYCYYKGWCEYSYVCPDGMQPLRPTP